MVFALSCKFLLCLQWVLNHAAVLGMSLQKQCPLHKYFLSGRQLYWNSWTLFYQCSHWGRGRTQPGVQKSKACWRFQEGAVGSTSSNAMRHQKKNQPRTPENRFLKLFWRRRKCQIHATGKQSAETLKVGWVLVFIFYFPVFHPSDLMGCGRYMGEFSQSNPPIKKS